MDDRMQRAPACMFPDARWVEAHDPYGRNREKA
jgi:hypothetical protein